MDKMHLLAAIDPGVLSSEITYFLLSQANLKEEETNI